jgi:hypothetical protein
LIALWARSHWCQKLVEAAPCDWGRKLAAILTTKMWIEGLLIYRRYYGQRGRDGVDYQVYHLPIVQFVTAPVMEKKDS